MIWFWLFSAPLVEADKETDEKNYILWRIENGVAEGSSEIPKGATLLTGLSHIFLIEYKHYICMLMFLICHNSCLFFRP